MLYLCLTLIKADSYDTRHPKAKAYKNTADLVRQSDVCLGDTEQQASNSVLPLYSTEREILNFNTNSKSGPRSLLPTQRQATSPALSCLLPTQRHQIRP